MRDRVCIDHYDAKLTERIANRGLPAADAARQTQGELAHSRSTYRYPAHQLWTIEQMDYRRTGKVWTERDSRK